MEHIIRIIGVVVALGFVLFSIDDLIWDIISIVRKIRDGAPERLPIERLDAVPPKLLAVMIAAWHEDNVIEPVIDNMIAALQYPLSMYHVFIGVYPNDAPTIAAVERLGEKYENVHMVVNSRPGPTCKADNINNMLRYIRQFETERRWRFFSVTVHDSEDVVHPYELKLTNYLIERHDVLQFPVIPLQKMPDIRSVFRSMTTGTYADEFAENHYRTMGTRESMSAVVPSAGTGFVISHVILDGLHGAPLFPEDSLTEDYKLSLMLTQKGYNIHFVLERVPRLMDNNTVRWDYVATRSFFPDTFRTATRQKMRWIYGITMQSIKISDIFRTGKMGFAARYSLYKDAKAKASNLMVLPGYLVFIYFLLSLFLPLPDMYTRHSLAWGLCVFLTFMMVFRQTMRAVAIANFYGFKSMAVACLLPPLMPVRLVWGNIINLTATLKAWKLYFLGAGTKKKKGKVAWNKTDHTFLNRHVLYRYYRNVGDVLLEKQYLSVSALSGALRRSRTEGRRIGDILLSEGAVTEEQLMEAVANVQHRLFIRDIAPFANGAAADFDGTLLEELAVYPLFSSKGRYVFAAADATPIEKIPGLLGVARENCGFVYSARQSILAALHGGAGPATAAREAVGRLLDRDAITMEQAVLALGYQAFTPDILEYMGLRDTEPAPAPVALAT
ncbi:adsorption protein B [Sporobacter termitidis DSM 10068]|uniref:Adsorption protein B n=1 Tax=Sporobacter termitidis DSM 10068 TaxID=1123282 RepID=A0A1M5VFK2_9FIRM|nr:glycosyltransferase [Sporobacter termitidis]SHH73928.1 adsorption protein B [Sporobacter termitidis DSM 10068]